MSSDPYNARVREYFADPQHAGGLKGAAMSYFSDQGIHIRLAATVSGERITGMRFRAWGCPHVIAAAEATCRQYEGRPVAALEEFTSAQIMQDLAIPIEKTGRILVLEDTVRMLGQAIRDSA